MNQTPAQEWNQSLSKKQQNEVLTKYFDEIPQGINSFELVEFLYQKEHPVKD